MARNHAASPAGNATASQLWRAGLKGGMTMAKPKKYESSGSAPEDGSVRIGGGGGTPPPNNPKPPKQSTPSKGGSKISKGA